MVGTRLYYTNFVYIILDMVDMFNTFACELCIRCSLFVLHLKRGCIELKYYADAIHSGLTPPGNNS